MQGRDMDVLERLIRFHDTGPLARLCSGVALTLTSVLIILGAVAAAQWARPAQPIDTRVVLAGQSGVGGG